MHWSWTESVLAYEPVHVMLTSNFQHEAFVSETLETQQ